MRHRTMRRVRTIRVWVEARSDLARKALEEFVRQFDGFDAMPPRRASRATPAGVILGRFDVMLFDLDCRRAATRLTELQTVVRRAPAVVVLSEESPEEVLHLTQLGALGFITASADLEECATVLRAAARGKFACAPHLLGSILRDPPSRPTRAGPVSERRGTQLSPRERTVALLLAAGLSNKQIADRLAIDLGTTKNHVHRILEKLGVQHRWEVSSSIGSEPPVELVRECKTRPRG